MSVTSLASSPIPDLSSRDVEAKHNSNVSSTTRVRSPPAEFDWRRVDLRDLVAHHPLYREVGGVAGPAEQLHRVGARRAVVPVVSPTDSPEISCDRTGPMATLMSRQPAITWTIFDLPQPDSPTTPTLRPSRPRSLRGRPHEKPARERILDDAIFLPKASSFGSFQVGVVVEPRRGV
jgi:hypothetical protein